MVGSFYFFPSFSGVCTYSVCTHEGVSAAKQRLDSFMGNPGCILTDKRKENIYDSLIYSIIERIS